MAISIHTQVSRGKHKGVLLTPHKHKEGHYVVSLTRFEKDYILVNSLSEALAYIHRGYSIRMSSSSPRIAPSLISPKSLRIEE